MISGPRRRPTPISLRLSLLFAVLATVSCARDIARAAPAPTRGPSGALRDHWRSPSGTCMEIPEWDVHELDRDLYILRQSPCASYEKPFVFLIFGDDRALLLDTGAGQDNHLATTVVRLVRQWRERTGHRSIALIVAHTHEHDDHTAGDADLAALRIPELPVQVTALDLEATQRLFGIAHWPDDIGQLELGGRILDAIPLPGHSKLSVALYDRRTAILFSGDTLYPGRLYMSDAPAFEASIARLVRFTADRPVAHVIGNHIEQTATPFRDYPIGTIFQPDEHELALPRGALLELQAALVAMHGAPRRVALRDFTIWPTGPGLVRAEEIERGIEEHERTKWSRPPQVSPTCSSDAPR
ncbi:MAG: MBL fold metallo-hydrolase [Deltaproteobacteria bacterium]|nr:MAG: MBL fold metallo-hydrolase [Deltaproteobacteria bacterium]